jgi:hypothetical protein
MQISLTKGLMRWLVTFAGIFGFLASLFYLGFGLLFFNNLEKHTALMFLTFASPLFVIASIFSYQVKPSGKTASWTLLSVLLVTATWMLWLSDGARGIIH